MSLRRRILSVLIACPVAAASALVAPGASDASAPAPKVQLSATATVEETYDTNVMLQSVTPLAHQESWVTSFSSQMSLDWRAHPMAVAKLSYAPGWTRFHSRSSEDFVAHRIAATLTGKDGSLSYTTSFTAGIIDGSNDSPIWTGPGGAPATGGATIRDRRDQAVYRASARVDWTRGDWFVRPVASLYVADFQTRIRTIAGCQNSVDRDDLSVGLDLGRTVRPGCTAALGYRHGRQNQARLLAYPEEYDNTYDRFLGVFEGAPVRWLKLAVTAGPEFRRYGSNVHATFPDRTVTNLFVDASATVTITGRDTVTAVARQFEQLSSSGRGAFEDLNLDLAWRHTLSSRASAGVVLHAYNTDFLRPAVRNDWLLTARFHGSYAINNLWAVDGAFTREQGISRVRNTAGREYTRSLFSVSARVKF